MILIYVTSEVIQAWSKNYLNIRPKEKRRRQQQKTFGTQKHKKNQQKKSPKILVPSLLGALSN